VHVQNDKAPDNKAAEGTTPAVAVESTPPAPVVTDTQAEGKDAGSSS
jgi:hypothetical protein